MWKKVLKLATVLFRGCLPAKSLLNNVAVMDLFLLPDPSGCQNLNQTSLTDRSNTETWQWRIHNEPDPQADLSSCKDSDEHSWEIVLRIPYQRPHRAYASMTRGEMCPAYGSWGHAVSPCRTFHSLLFLIMCCPEQFVIARRISVITSYS